MNRNQSNAAELRIIGGTHRGRKIRYNGDRQTRPMKDRVREAVFNLVGPSIKGMHAIDLFSGTGAVALEALSRGAVRATAIERHFEMVKQIQENSRLLGLADRIDVLAGDTFVWARKIAGLEGLPAAIFCCPPYALYRSQLEELCSLVQFLQGRVPAESMILVEADPELDFGILPCPGQWDVRTYLPACVGLYRKPVDAIPAQAPEGDAKT